MREDVFNSPRGVFLPFLVYMKFRVHCTRPPFNEGAWCSWYPLGDS